MVSGRVCGKQYWKTSAILGRVTACDPAYAIPVLCEKAVTPSHSIRQLIKSSNKESKTGLILINHPYRR